MLTIGDKNAERLKMIAGPYYGLFDFDRAQEQFLLGDGTPYLKAPCALSPDMTDEEWDAFSRELLEAEIAEQEAEENHTEFLLDDATYEALYGKVYSGLLPLGSQGCSLYHALVLNGKYAGRVVNIDVDLRKPKCSQSSHPSSFRYNRRTFVTLLQTNSQAFSQRERLYS